MLIKLILNRNVSWEEWTDTKEASFGQLGITSDLHINFQNPGMVRMINYTTVKYGEML